MTPGAALQPMRPEVAHEAMGCTSCHDAHRSDTRVAAARACLRCHADEHSLAYEGSAHARLWRAEQAGEAKPGTGVSCATCHLPRVLGEGGTVTVEHNQNETLRPNEKFVRVVCQSCHGVGLSLDALADPELIRNNFDRAPSRSVDTHAMVRARMKRRNP
jgi:hypothetical protein